MRRWLRDPLLHFSLGGLLLFIAYACLNPSDPHSDVRRVRVGAGEMKWLAATWRGQTGREPTAEELRELVSNLIKEELLSREAREMRLDENDTIVRRRLAQKLEFVIQDTARLAEPSDDELRQFYAASRSVFQTEARVSFTQIFFRREQDAAAALSKLVGATPAEAARFGERLMIEAEFRHADRHAVAAAFGPQFARAIFDLQPGAWHGPIESGYGAHLVRVSAVEASRPQDFADVRPLVVERWREAKQREAEARFFERLMAKYAVLIDDSVKAAIGAPLDPAQRK